MLADLLETNDSISCEVAFIETCHKDCNNQHAEVPSKLIGYALPCIFRYVVVHLCGGLTETFI